MQCPCIFFLITGSEHDETIWAGAYHKCDQRRLRRACAFVQSCKGPQSFLVDEDQGPSNPDIYVVVL